MEWFERFSHLECLCSILCVSTCVQMSMCVSEFGARCFREKDFVRSTRPGEVMVTGRRQSTRLLCSLLLGLSLVQLLARGQWSETLRQGALPRLDPRIELQRKQRERGE